MHEDDFPLARRWLLEPHVRRWWHDDPKETDFPEGTLRDWRSAIRGEDPTDMFVMEIDGRAIGMIQSYVAQDYADHIAEIGELSERALEVDLFIGEPGLIGQGHGPALLRAFLLQDLARRGLAYCVIGPARANVAAIRAYEKIGFRYLRDYREDDTIDPEHLLLELRGPDLG
ncbi:MAG TPA: GNAT family N-acetyltransferase [Candidatus Limnocylindria bacterium]